jgi:hypothetical protein
MDRIEFNVTTGQKTIIPMTAEEVEALQSTTPQAVVFPALTKVQFWLAALNVGITKSDVLTLINQITDKPTREQATIMLEETMLYKRNDPFVTQFSQMMGISSSQLDQLWIGASTI